MGSGDLDLYGCYIRVFPAHCQGKGIQPIQNDSCRWLHNHYSGCKCIHTHTYYIFELISYQLYSHHAPALPFIIAVSIVYLLDRILCLLKTRLVTATISPLSTFSATRLVIPSLNHGWRAGQHVRIRVLSTSLGWFGWRQSHPFTIASAPADSDTNLTGEEGLVLICKKAGGWTGKLFDMSKASRPLESGACITHRTVHVLIEGPYGN